MPAFSNIVINGGDSIAYTFIPIGRDSNGVAWFEQSIPLPTSPIGAARIGYKQTRELNPSGREVGISKTVYTLNVPTLETLGTDAAGLTPPPTVAYKEAVRLSFDLAERSTEDERVNTRTLAMNLLGSAMVIQNLDFLRVSY